jgi:DNA polymerase IV
MAPRRILHVDLEAFFVSVERAADETLRGRPVVVGGGGGATGIVAAASSEAREAGVRPGMSIGEARRLCPEAVVRPGDLDRYAAISEEITSLLLRRSRRVERPSVDEAYVDLGADGASGRGAVPLAEEIKDELQRRLHLDASLGLASTRLAARVASAFARPRGLLVVLPGYEQSFLFRQPVSALPELPPHLEQALVEGGLPTIGDVAAADDVALTAAVGSAAARLRAVVSGADEAPFAVAGPPAAVYEEAQVRDRRTDRAGLESLLEALARRASQKLAPFGLVAESATVEVRRAQGASRRSRSARPGLGDAETVQAVVTALGEPLLEPPQGIQSLAVRLHRLVPAAREARLFPPFPGAAGL